MRERSLVEALRGARSVFVLTGAGMSAESGLPTFRGVDGYWGRYRVEELASPQGFARDPLTVWRWYNQRILAYRNAQPNAGHYALVRLERLVPKLTIATQNVDSLHARAGSKGVLELHGHLREARCTACDERISLADGLDEAHIEHGCGGRFRPQVVWFGEMLPEAVWQRAADAAARADLILVVGTSAQVYPAAALATQNAGAFIAEINPDATALSESCDCVIREGAATALPRLVRLAQEPALCEKDDPDEGSAAGDAEEHPCSHERGD
jgi:NAD-dependent deacetylase